MKKIIAKKMRGFTLIELLIVLFMLGLVMGSIFSLYRTQQRSAYVSEEVVEVQQNLRVAIDSLTRDIRSAGLVTPRTNPVTSLSTPVSNASTAAEITINVGSMGSDAAFAIIAAERVGLGQFQVTTNDSVDPFNVGDIIAIARPNNNNSLPGGAANRFRVKSRDRTIPMIELEVHPGPPLSADNNATYLRSDVIVRSGLGNFTRQIRYCLGPAPGVPGCGPLVTTCPANQQCLIKIVDGVNPEVIAQNLAANPLQPLQFSYMLDDLTETTAPADFGKIRAVRVRLIGRTVTTQALSDDQQKERRIESIIQIRNRTPEEVGP